MGSFRRLANKALDAAFIPKAAAGLRPGVVILHGASCSGKSYILRRLRRRYAGCTYVEMDNLKYWRTELDPSILTATLSLLTDAGVDRDNATALVRSIEQTGSEPERNFSPYNAMVELIEKCLTSDAVIATCGNLPPPHLDYGYYQLLTECTGLPPLHILVAPENAVLARRVQLRGQAALVEERIASNNWRLRNREFYHLHLTGNEPIASILESIRASITRLELRPGLMPRRQDH